MAAHVARMAPCTSCAPVAGVQYTEPPAKWLNRPTPSGVPSSSVSGKPSTLRSQPMAANSARMAPCTSCAPVAGVQYTEPPAKWLTRPTPSGVPSSSVSGKPSTLRSQPMPAHSSRMAPCTSCAPVAGDQYIDPPSKCCPAPPATGNSDAVGQPNNCLLYTSDAADEEDSVDLGGRRIIK